MIRIARGVVPVLALGLFLSVPGALAGQQGTITGSVLDAETGSPVAGATIEFQGPETRRVSAGPEGRFRADVRAGTYAVIVTMIGYEPSRTDGVRVSAGETRTLEISLRSRALALAPMSVTVGRGVEQKTIEAPASVSVVGEEEIRARPAPTPLDHVRAVPGVDIATHGVQSGNIVARGFNNVFSGSLHMLTDHRLAGVPSLRVNLMHLIQATDEDIERVEVVLGPGSALYGPNTANGVLHVLTKSPLRTQETVFSAAGGEQSLFHGTFRTSHLLTDNLGIKLSGQYLRGDEWEHRDPVEEANRQSLIDAGVDPGRVGARDFDIERWSGELRADWRIDDRSTAIFQFGRSQSINSIELTGIGAAQARDWTYDYFQVRFNRGRLFAQTYLNTSDAGDTFTLRDGDPIIDESKLLVSQLQHGTSLGDRQDFTYGVDYIRTMPETEGTVHGRHEDDDTYDEFGVYVQSETRLTDQLRFVGAARVDWHSELPDPVFSPRAALVFSPAEGHNFRGTFNRAFSTPTSVNLFLDINAGPFPDPTLAAIGYGLRAQGSAGQGFTFRGPDGSLSGMRSPFNPAGAHQVIPAQVPVMWEIAVGVLMAQGAIDAQTAGFMLANTPTGDEVMRAYLDVLNPQLPPPPLTDDVELNVPPLEESNTQTWEIGYSGLLADRVLLSADVWYERRRNFISALTIATPLLFMESQSLGGYAVPLLTQHFMDRGLPQDQAEAAAMGIVQGMAGLPVGVLASEDVSSVTGRSDFLVTYRNFGRVTLWGSDLSAQIILNDAWRLNLAASFVSDGVFSAEEGERVTLNAPTRRLAAGVRYRDEIRGFTGEVRGRFNNEFPVLSAPFTATECLGDTGPLVEPCVDSFFLVDLSAGYRLRWVPGASIHLNVQNVFDEGYRSFAGVPEVGRLALLRLRYQF